MKKRRNTVPKIYLKMFSEIDRHKRERQAAEMSRPMKNMLDLLAQGECYEIEGKTVLPLFEIDKKFNKQADWLDVAQAISDWVDFWTRLEPKAHAYDMRVLAKNIGESKLITQALMDKARAEFDAMVARLPDISLEEIAKAVRTTNIATAFAKLQQAEQSEAEERKAA